MVTGVGAAGPDYSLQINGYAVLGDIDRLYLMGKAGAGDAGLPARRIRVEPAAASAGGGARYRVPNRLPGNTLAAVGTESR